MIKIKKIKLIWLSANRLGYELLKEALKIKEIKVVAILTLSSGAKTKMYDAVDRKKWHEFNIPVYEIGEVNKEIKLFKSLKPDIVVMCGWRQIIDDKILNVPRKNFIAFHPTLLPKGRGPTPIINSILSDIKKLGLTMFHPNQDLDAGDIIGQESFKIEDDDYAIDVYNKVIKAGRLLIKKFLSLLAKNKAPRIQQNDQKATYFLKKTSKDNEINLSDSPEEIYRKIRAFSKPYNGAYIKLNNKNLIIWKAALRKKNHCLGYKETLENLSTRKNIHKQFSQFEINDWIADIVKIKKGEKILDIGCGEGKQVEAYLKLKGVVTGADKNPELLKRAKENNRKASFEIQNFDRKFRWKDSSFDLVSCCFAIYYAKDIQKTLLEMQRVLKNNGRLFICGPTENNAIELNKIHEKVIRQKIPQTAILRIKRMKNEVLPIIKKHFDKVRVKIFRNKISFPDAKSFINYYSSTLLFKEGVPYSKRKKILKKMEKETNLIIKNKKSFNINKEVISILAYKKN